MSINQIHIYRCLVIFIIFLHPIPVDRNQKHTLFTCSMDSTMKIWDIPEEGFVVDSSAPVATFSTATRTGFRGIACHPQAENVVAVRGAREACVVDTVSLSELFSIKSDTFGSNDLQSFGWSYDGKVLFTTGKDKILRQFDIRSSQLPTAETVVHGNLSRLIPNLTPNLSQVNPIFTPDLPQLKPNFIPDLSQLNPNFIPNLPQLIPNLTPNLPQLIPNFTPNLPRRKSQFPGYLAR